MGDVLFDFGKYNLRSEAREKLAKLTGIVLAHPGLKLAVEGHTDSVGGDEGEPETLGTACGRCAQILGRGRIG